MDERVFRDLTVRPDFIHDFLFVHQMPGSCRKKPKQQPSPRAQGHYVAASIDQQLAAKVDGPVAEND
jgi:hypothetical protein